MMRFMCGEDGHFSDDDDLIEIDANCPESAAQGFIDYVDSRDSEWFARPDDAHTIIVKRGDRTWKFGASFDYRKSWRLRSIRETETAT